jgi:hypothetical protein
MPEALGALWRNRETGRRGGKRKKERQNSEKEESVLSVQTVYLTAGG